MTPGDSTQLEPIALREGEGEALWFLGHLLTIKASGATTGGGMAVIENLAAQGPASPLHVHRNESEWFYVLEGELTFWVGGDVIVAPKGAFVFAPVGIPHTFSVTSPEARFLLGTDRAGFEDFVRTVGEPAAALGLPPPPDGPPDVARLAALAAEYGIEILGPPGIPE